MENQPSTVTRKSIGNILVSRMFLLVAALLSLSACASTGGYVSGQVLDAETQVPIPDAHVVIISEGGEYAYVERKTVCVHADGTLTNTEGKFQFTPWVKPDGLLPIADIRHRVVVYKPGYEEVRSRRKKSDPYILRRTDGSREDSLEYLRLIPRRASCGKGGSSRQSLYPLYESMYYEAKTLSISKEDIKRLEWFRKLAASQAIATDKHLTQSEADNLREKFLEDNLK